MKTAVYVRVSTADQDVSAQRRELENYLTYKGITDYTIYADAGYSGKNMDRPAYTRMLEDFKRGETKTLYVYKLDRLSRSLSDLLMLLNRLNELSIDMISIKDNIDMGTPSGKLMMHMLGAFAEFERSVILERTRGGIANARAKGVKFGRPSSITTELKARMVELNKNGLSIRKIAKELNVGITTVATTLTVAKKLTVA